MQLFHQELNFIGKRRAELRKQVLEDSIQSNLEYGQKVLTNSYVMKPTFPLLVLLLLLAIPSAAQKFRCPVYGTEDMKFKMGMTLVIHDKAVVLKLRGQTDSLVFVRKQTPDHRDIRYNDGVKDFVMTVAERQGTMEGEEYNYMLMTTPEDKSIKTATYYCVKEK